MSVQLGGDEILVLVTLARYVMRADGKVTEAEIRTMMQMAREVGLRAFSDALETTSDARLTREELVRLAGMVHDQEKRRAMYDMLHALAASDELVGIEKELLRTISDVWCLD